MPGFNFRRIKWRGGKPIDKKIDLTVISSINRKINSRMSLANLLTSIMDVAKELLSSEGSSLLLADTESGDLIFDIVIGDKGDIIRGQRVPRGKGIAGTVAETCDPIIVNDVHNDPRFFDEIDRKSHFKTRNLLCVPMLVMEEFVGVLEIVNSIGRDVFGDFDLELARYVADQAAIAINNRRLYDELNNRVEELEAIYEVSQSISYTCTDDDLLKNVIRSLSKSMKVRRGSIIIFDEDGEKLRIKSSFGLPDFIAEGHEVDMENSIAGHVFRRGDPMLVSDISRQLPQEMLVDNRTYITESFVSVPIYSKNKTIGVLSLSDKINGKNFDSFDLRVISTASTQISEAYVNILNQQNEERQRRLKQEIEIAAEMQRKILKEIPKGFQGHKLDAFNMPAKVVGGDFYDFYSFDENKYSVLVADISGKGIPAAMFMGTARNVVRAERRVEWSPAHLLRNANKFIYNDSEYGMFVTLFYCVIDSHNNLITYGSAGHNDQLFVKSRTKEVVKLNAQGKALGLSEDQHYEEKVMLFEPGDMLLLYTDGVTESFGGDRMDIEFGERKLSEIALEYIEEGPAEMIEHLKSFINDNSIDIEFRDDFTILAVQF